MPENTTPPGDLAAKLNHLFDTIKRPDGRAYSNATAAEAISATGDESISKVYLWELRNGKKTNPTMRHLAAIADFFGVPTSYFLDQDVEQQVKAELELLHALRDNNIRALALRAQGLSPATLAALTQMATSAREVQGLPPTPE